MNTNPYLWPVGKGGLVAPNRIVAIGMYKSAPVRRIVRQAESANLLIDLTYGEVSKWAIFLDSGHVVLATGPLPGTFWDELDDIGSG